MARILSEQIRIQLLAKSLILRVYDILAATAANSIGQNQYRVAMVARGTFSYCGIFESLIAFWTI
jgi:hypothetical protein